MYANLTVRVSRQGGGHDVYAAHHVEVTPTGVIIHRDNQNGNGTEPIPAGTLKVAGARSIDITPDF